MYFVCSSAELIELFFLNSWELLGCGQMPLGTRCVSVCVHLCVCHCKHVFHRATVIARVCQCMPEWKLCVWCVCAWHAGRWSVSGIFSGLQASLVPWLSHRAVLVERFIKLCLEYSGHMCSAATDELWAGADGVCARVCAWKQGDDGAKPSWQRCYPAAGSCAPSPPPLMHAHTWEHTHTHHHHLPKQPGSQCHAGSGHV